MIIALFFTLSAPALVDNNVSVAREETPPPGGPPVVEEHVAPGGASALVRKKGCVVLGVDAFPGPKRRALFTRLCPGGDASIVEERGVVDGILGVVRFRRLVVDGFLASPTTPQPRSVPQPAYDDADRKIRDAFGRIVAIGADRDALFKLLANDENARAVVAQTIAWRGMLAGTDDAHVYAPLVAFFEHTIGPRFIAQPAVRWSSSGARFALEKWPYGDWVPPVGYASPESTLYDFDTLAPLLNTGYITRFEGERAVVSILGERSCAPATYDELLGRAEATTCAHPIDRSDEPFQPRGVYERWEGVVDVDNVGTPHFVRAIGPFKHSDACGERGPPGIPAAFKYCDGS